MELLSPAGSKEALAAALKHGANAVYLGLTDFSARAGAENFDREQFKQACADCAQMGVKVYVTLNTLLTDRQLPQMEDAIGFLAQNGADGVIVQDLATARLVRSIAPELPLHASTQMGIYNLEGVKILERLGFSRVVLARELSAAEIAHIAKNTCLEIEVFVHGALCMCYSGHCYFSSVIGRNSGNRGRCAQPCRLPYENGYPLSLKDLSLLTHINELKDAGVDSLKIEGRLKSPAYVGAVTAAFARALQGQAIEQSTLKQLEDLFSRDGFTDGYWTGQTGKNMFGIKTPTAYSDYKAAVSSLEQQKPAKRFPLDITVDAHSQLPCRFQFSDGERQITLQSPAAQPAQNKPLDEMLLRQRLDKLQDTPYVLRDCHLHADGDLFIPVSQINEMRRLGIAALDKARRQRGAVYTVHPFHSTVTSKQTVGGIQVLYHAPDAFNSNVDHQKFKVVWLRPEDLHLYEGDNRGAIIPHFYPAGQLMSLLQKLKAQGIRRVLVGNMGHILPCKEMDLEIWGDYGLNITNSIALEEAGKLGLKNACLSFELSLPQLRDMQRSMPTTMIVYGRLPLMQFKNCIICAKQHCLQHNGWATLTDRKGQHFLLQCAPDCSNTLYNSVPLFLEHQQSQWFAEVDKRFDFTDETPKQAAKILENYVQNVRPEGNYTAGLYKRGVI